MRLLGARGFQSIHRGVDTQFVNEDINRLVPLDALEEMCKDGLIGAIFPIYFVTTGVGTTMANSKSIGSGIAAELKTNNVSGVILTAT